LLGRIAPERDQQVERMLRGDAGLGQARAQRRGTWRAGLATPEQHFLHDVQPRHLVLRRQHRRIRDIIGIARIGIEGVHMRPQPGADQQRPDREILVAAVLAGPFLDRTGGGAQGAASV
jgi:hypothetical protein